MSRPTHPTSIKDDPKYNLRISRQYEYIPKVESFLKPSFIQRALSIPFAPTWAFGVDIYTKYRNLTTNKSNYKLFYTVSHVGILYSHTTNEMQFLMGHRNFITSISADQSGKWLVTADNCKDNSVIVWDSEECFPVRTIFDPHPDVGVTQVAMSHDAKFLVTVGAEPEPIIKFWLWTFGYDDADGIFNAKSSYGDVKIISFNPIESTHFAVTFSEAILFFTWDEDENKLSEKMAEIVRKRTRIYGHYTDTAYIPYSHECLTVTTTGWVIVWGLTFFTVPYDSIPPNNNKIFLKAIKLQKDGINFITYVDSVISTTDFEGNIRFYDEKLQILYFCHKFSLPPIVMIAFNLSARKFVVQDPMVFESDRAEAENIKKTQEISNDTEKLEEEIENEEVIKKEQSEPIEEKLDIEDNVEIVEEEQMSIKGEGDDLEEPNVIEYEEFNSATNIINEQDEQDEPEKINEDEDDDNQNMDYNEDDRSDEYEKIYLNLLPSDFTLQRSPFLVRDYIILTANGQFAYVDAIENKLDFFLSTNYSSITCMDIHTKKPILILGYANGFLYSYNYEESKLLIKINIMNSKEENYNELTSVRYSPLGLFLACGTAGGHLWFLDPITMQPLYKKAFIYEHSKIIDIKFSPNNRYLAYYDVSRAVCLLKLYDNEDQNPEWVFHGRFIAHTKIVAGLLFCDNSRLFTVGRDRYLVEYYVKESKPGKLDIMSRIPIMQRGYPIAFNTYDIMCEEGILYFLISTNEYKYLVVNYQTSTLERTILAPYFEDPVKRLKVVLNQNNKYYMIFNTSKYLGLQMLPISGNPYKQVSLIAHSSHIEIFKLSACGKFVFTTGENDNICIMWTIRYEALDFMSEQGGQQLCPYYGLIEGGSEGWLFHEMKDLFYYMQILHQGEDSPFPRHVSDKIPTSELPNLMRAIGYYPTEFELDNILYEVKYYYIDNMDDAEEEINFENFLKLYINHRPVESFRKDEVRWAFLRMTDENLTFTRQHFIDTLCSIGESFTTLSLQHCLSILTHHHTGEQVPRYAFNEMLPDNMTYEYFMSEILGVENSEYY